MSVLAYRRFSALLAAFLASSTLSGAVDPESADEKEYPKITIPKIATSSEGFITVMAVDVPSDPIGFRLPILNYASRKIREISRVYDLEIPRGDSGLIINALNGTNADTRVITKISRSSKRRLVTKITLPSPGYSDMDVLNYEIGAAFFRSWLDSKSNDDVPPDAIPPLFIVGLMRAMDRKTSVEDTRFVLDLWSRAAIPPFRAMCDDMFSENDISPHIAGYFAFRLRQKHLVKPFLERIISGRKCDGGYIAEILTGTNDPVEQDRQHDEALIKLSRSVLSPGESGDWDIRVFSSRLLLFSSIFGKNNSEKEACTFRDAISRSKKEEWIKEAALMKARVLPFYAMGRGELLAEASRAYAVFLQALGRGDTSPETLGSLLDIADGKLRLAAEKETRKTGAEASSDEN